MGEAGGMAEGAALETLYCHVCGECLARGEVGHSPFELGCGVCQAGFHVEGDTVTYVLATWIEHHEPPATMPLAGLRDGRRARRRAG